jgi:chromosome partitioning protein
VIIPLQCEYYALEGLTSFLNTFSLVQRKFNQKLKIRGILLTMYDSHTSLSQQVSSEVINYFKNQVFTTIIPRNVRLSEAPSYGKPIFIYDPNSKGAEAYKKLAMEFLENE